MREGVAHARRLAAGELRGSSDIACDTEPGDPNEWPRPFANYLLGHDAVADHRFRIQPNSPARSFLVEWTGRLALIYGGADVFEHEFRAVIPNAAFVGIRLPDDVDPAVAIESARKCLAHPEDFVHEVVDGATWLRLKG